MPKGTWTLAVLFVLLCGAVTAGAQTAVTEDFEYKINAGDGVTITAYTGKTKDVVIPEEIAGKTVTEIDDNAFLNKGITSVTLPAGLKKIGKEAFAGNHFTELVIPPGVQYIGEEAFDCSTITSLTLPAKLPGIGKRAFHAFSGYIVSKKRGGTYTRQGDAFFYNGKALPQHAIIISITDAVIKNINGASPSRYEMSGCFYLRPGRYTFELGFITTNQNGTFRSKENTTRSYTLEAGMYRLRGILTNAGINYSLQKR